MNQNIIDQLQEQMEDLKMKLEKQMACSELRSIWIPKIELMQFMGFAETQFNEIVNRYKIVYTIIGKKRFYLRESVMDVLNAQKNNQYTNQ